MAFLPPKVEPVHPESLRLIHKRPKADTLEMHKAMMPCLRPASLGSIGSRDLPGCSLTIVSAVHSKQADDISCTGKLILMITCNIDLQNSSRLRLQAVPESPKEAAASQLRLGSMAQPLHCRDADGAVKAGRPEGQPVSHVAQQHASTKGLQRPHGASLA